MRFVFWQNVISIHQSAFIRALAENNDVSLVVEKKIDNSRKSDGWSVPSMGNAKIVINPSDDDLKALLASSHTEHVFSGIDAFPLVYRAFKTAVSLNLEVSVMAEPYQWQGFKGILRRLKYALLYLRYGSHIKHFFATGQTGIDSYQKAGFPLYKLHQWGYFTEQKVNDVDIKNEGSLPNLIFIGKIDARKNILSLAEVAMSHTDLFGKFYILGTGPLESELKRIIENNSKIEFVGPVPNNQIATYLHKSDLLVLPSLFDGWGAVVNEALSQGVRVLCSNRCGASVLLDDSQLGGVFNLSEEDDLERQLTKWLGYGKLTSSQRKDISEWSKRNISGRAAASYFEDIEQDKVIKAPWLTPPVLTYINLIYVGRLDANKNIINLLSRFDDFGQNIRQFTVVGDGPLMPELTKLALNNRKIVVKGRLSNDDSVKEMGYNDYLVLPSLYDGWGAVVNEALTQGTRVLCSKECGASILLDGKSRGESFKRENMIEIIKKWCSEDSVSSINRKEIRNWSLSCITGVVAADYFVKIFKGDNIKAPWIANEI